jgi:hypothetical protein
MSRNVELTNTGRACHGADDGAAAAIGRVIHLSRRMATDEHSGSGGAAVLTSAAGLQQHEDGLLDQLHQKGRELASCRMEA